MGWLVGSAARAETALGFIGLECGGFLFRVFFDGNNSTCTVFYGVVDGNDLEGRGCGLRCT